MNRSPNSYVAFDDDGSDKIVTPVWYVDKIAITADAIAKCSAQG